MYATAENICLFDLSDWNLSINLLAHSGALQVQDARVCIQGRKYVWGTEVNYP